MAAADFLINASAQADGGFDATTSQVLTLQLENAPGLDSARVQFSVVIASKDAPALTFVPSDGRPATPTGTVTVTMPGSGAHSYQIQCEVNEGQDATGATNSEYTRSRIVAMRTGTINARKWVPGETTQYDATGGWVYEQNDLVDNLAAAILAAAGVPAARTITAGAGLTGGGDLSADRTINVAAADASITVNADSIAVGVISDAQHGTRGNGTLHGAATGAANGFMPSAHFTLVNNATGAPNPETIALRGLSGECGFGFLRAGSPGQSTGTLRLGGSATITLDDGAGVALTAVAVEPSGVIGYGANADVLGLTYRVATGGFFIWKVNDVEVAKIGTNIHLLGATSVGGGTGVVAIANASAVPTTDPTGGGILYAEGGAGKWRGSSGTVTTFGPADPHCPMCERDFALEWRNDRNDEHVAVCVPCMLEALTGADIDVSTFAFVRRLT